MICFACNKDNAYRKGYRVAELCEAFAIHMVVCSFKGGSRHDNVCELRLLSFDTGRQGRARRERRQEEEEMGTVLNQRCGAYFLLLRPHRKCASGYLLVRARCRRFGSPLGLAIVFEKFAKAEPIDTEKLYRPPHEIKIKL